MVSWACGSWSSHPLVSCFFSLALLVSLNSFVYLRERHISWGFSAPGAFEGSCSESWSLGLAVLEPHAHAFVWYFFSLVWFVSLVVISLVVISLVVISLVVLCLQHTRQHDAHQERPAQSNVHARPRDARVESAQVNRPRACMRLPVARHLCWQAAHRPMSRQPCTCACMCATHEVGRFASVLASHPSRIVTSTSIVCKAQSMCAGKARRTRAKPRHRNPSARHASLVKVENFYPRVKLIAPLRVARLLWYALRLRCNLAAVSLPGSLLGSLPVSLCSTPR